MRPWIPVAIAIIVLGVSSLPPRASTDASQGLRREIEPNSTIDPKVRSH